MNRKQSKWLARRIGPGKSASVSESQKRVWIDDRRRNRCHIDCDGDVFRSAVWLEVGAAVFSCGLTGTPRFSRGIARLILQEKNAIFSCKIGRDNMPQSSENRILKRIRGTGSGWAFSPRDFLDLGERPTIDSALHRLAQKAQVRRVIRGIYDYPRFSELLGQQLSPDIDQVARALARKFRWRIQPSGATALNLLGLSTQVPARAVYLSDGPDRSYKVGNTSLAFEHTALKEAGFKLRESGLIVQALRSLGQDRITPEIILKIRAWLPASLRPKILVDSRTATGWVYDAIQQIAQDEQHG